MLALCPAQGAGLALEDLRGNSDMATQQRVAALAGQLGASAAQLSDLIGQRYFTHAEVDTNQSD